jgi:DNA-binding MarR family transcriptional regulator
MISNNCQQSPSEARLIDALRRSGPYTIEALSSVSGLSWSQVFLAIDRLSRTGNVSLQRLSSCEYQVSANDGVA